MKPEIKAILRALIDGKDIEFSHGSIWSKSGLGTTLTVLAEREYGNDRISLRIKPKTIQIGEFTVPEPMRVPPLMHTDYYYIDLAYGAIEAVTWDDTGDESVWLANGMLQATKEGAEQQLAAILSLTKEKK